MKPLTISLSIISGVVLGAVIMAGAQIKAPQLLPWSSSDMSMAADTATAEKKPLYWVAPMDANYRRDKPGQSPMGMDLVPFYGDDDSGSSPGTVKISPEVVNNLGVRSASAVKQVFKQSINTVGYVRINEHEIKHVHPRVQGWIEKLYVKAVGDKIEQGAPLYDIYSPELVNAQEELLIALERKNKRLVKAAGERLLALQLTQAQVDALKRDKTVKQTLTIFAPKTGVVDQINIAEGFYVKPGTSMMAIVDLTNVWVEAQVYERQAAMVNDQMKVMMTLDYLPEKTWKGTVDYIYPKLDSKSRSLTVRILVDNQDLALKPNMFMTVNLQERTDTNHSVASVQIPTEALIRTGNSNRVVMKLDDGKYKSVEVKIGRIADGWVEIVSGVKEGEVVVTSAQFMIDSESSKTSDFKRIDSADAPMAGMKKKDGADDNKVSVQVTVNQLDLANNKVNLKHPPIAQWKWPAMDMDFTLADGLDHSLLQQGKSATVEITKQDKRTYLITKVDVEQKAEKAESVFVMATFNHLDIDNLKANVNHPAISEWKWPEMKMDFNLDPQLDLSKVSAGDEAHIEITKKDKRTYVITQIHLMGK